MTLPPAETEQPEDDRDPLPLVGLLLAALSGAVMGGLIMFIAMGGWNLIQR